MAIHIFRRLPEVSQLHVITFCNDRRSIPLVSRKFYEYWVLAGLAAIQACHQNSLVGRKAQEWDWGPLNAPVGETAPQKFDRLRALSQRIDAFLWAIAQGLSPRQTILPIPGRMNWKTHVRDRNPQALVWLDRRIVGRNQGDLIAFAEWLTVHTSTGGPVLGNWRALPTREQQADHIATRLREHGGTIQLQQSNNPAINTLREQDLKALSALPAEFIHLDADTPNIHAACLISMKRGQIPFLEAAGDAHRTEVIDLEEVTRWLERASACNNAYIAIQLLKDRRLTNEQKIRALNAAVIGNKGSIKNRLILIDTLIASVPGGLSAQEAGRVLAHAASRGQIPLPYRKAIVHHLLAKPGINSAAVHTALEYAAVENIEPLALEDRRAIVRILSDHPLCQTFGVEFALSCAAWWSPQTPLPLDHRLSILQLLSTHTKSSVYAKSQALAQVSWMGALPFDQRSAVIMWLLADPQLTGENLESALASACYDGERSLAERCQIIDLLLQDPKVAPQILEYALKRVALRGAQLSLQDRIAVVQKLRHDPRTPASADSATLQLLACTGNISHQDRMAMLQLISPACPLSGKIKALHFASCGGQLPLQERLEIVFFFLADPSMTDEGCGEALWAAACIGELSLQDRLALIDELCNDHRTTAQHHQKALLHLIAGPILSLSIHDRLSVMNVFLNNPLLTQEQRHSILKYAVYSTLPLYDRLELIRALLDDPHHPLAARKLMAITFQKTLFARSSEYQRSLLRTIAATPQASQFSFATRALLGFERFWAFVTAPLRDIILGRFTDVIFFPITLLRALAHRLIV